MEKESDPLRRRFAEGARPHFKSPLWNTVFAFLVESEMFERLAEAGVPFVRSFEGAPVDGALICPGQFARPREATTNLAIWQWALEQKDVEFIPIDVKSVSLHSGLGSYKNLDYTYSRPAGASLDNAEVLFLRFEELDNYTAIVPKAVAQSASGVAYGINGLISGVPCIWHPYMVHDRDLLAAVLSLTDKDAYYKNPTTGVTFTGFRPYRTRQPGLCPTAIAPRNSMSVLQGLFSEMQQSRPEFTVDLNPIAPLVGDFVLKIPEISELLCIEHKHKVWGERRVPPDLADLEQDDEDKIRRSPYARNRMWHFLIIQLSSTSKYVCFARHEVDESWIEHPPQVDSLPDAQNYIFEGVGAVYRLLDKIKRESAAAITAVNEVVENMRPHDSDIESLVTGTHIQSALEFSEQLARDLESQLAYEAEFVAFEVSEDGDEYEDTENTYSNDPDNEEDEFPGPSADTARPMHITEYGTKYYKVGGRLWNAVGLHWMCDELNKQCCQRGRMICFPVDHGHCLGNHVLVDHRWTPEEQRAFEDHGTLPVYVFSRDLQESAAIVLRFVDFSYSRPNSSYPLWMRGRYWVRPATRQHFMFLASTLPGISKEEAGSFYLLWPSQFTNIFQQGCRDDVEKPQGHRGERYFRSVVQEDERLPEPHSFTRHHKPLRFDKQSVFVPEEAPAPVHAILDLNNHSIYEHLLDLMEEKRPFLSIRNPQSEQVLEGFSMKLHKIKLGQLWQAAWDFGLDRRTPNLNRGDDRRASRVKRAAHVPKGMEALPDLGELDTGVEDEG